MLWSAEVSIAGPVGAMGQRVLQPIFRQQVDHVLATLETPGRRGGRRPATPSRPAEQPQPLGRVARSVPDRLMQLTMEPLAEMLATARALDAAASTRSGSPRPTRGGASTGWRRAPRPSSRR